ncbi:IS110 family RNA-guided transposase [Salininema proteolyticum]|uniref:IS110 family transposase n=1 Tax=Salininema proteolyticum TaxID=1607685 RepID=A0ABV8U0H6_9ACTN
MRVLYERCAGLDVHRDTVVATVRMPSQKRRGSRSSETRTFGTTVRELEKLADWLVCEQVELVGMEATGVYWKPVFAVLEVRLTCWLVNAAHLKNVPGRKTDVADSVWIARIMECGLVRPSFVPPKEFRELRDLTRARTAASQERVRVLQRLEKVLQDAGIKLTSVVAGVWSKSSRVMLEALMEGVTSPRELSELARERMRSKREALTEVLANRFTVEHHGVLVQGLVSHIDELEARVTEYDAEVARRLEPHAEMMDLVETIPGLGGRLSQVVVAEIGSDMTQFPTTGHLASWAGVCPGNHASGGKRRGGMSRPGPKWLKLALTEAAWSAIRNKDSYLAAHHMQIKGRAGGQKAVGAPRHDLVIAYWHIVHDHVPFRDLGADWVSRRFSVEHRAKRLSNQLEALGYSVSVERKDET